MIGHPEVDAAAKAAVDRFGTGAHGARLVSGTTSLHHQLEQALSEFLQAEEAVLYNSGYVTNVATIAALVGPEDCVIGDELNHASISDGCRFSGAKFLEFRHNDIDSLRAALREADGRRVLVAVDAVYSMEGDIADLPRIVDVCRQAGAMLMVDEAHSLGVLGTHGRGVQEHFNLPPDAIDVKMGTLSKSTASCGGFIAGRREIISFLKHHARGFIFSVALPAPQVAAALKALEILQREPERVERLRQVTQRYLSGLRDLGFRLPPTETPIVPILCDSEEQTLEMARRCREQGLFVIPILYPAVPRNAPRIRTNVMATHSDEDIDFALKALAKVGRDVGVVG
ncbi:MAG: aminotransferase class I/II-fold pyridoxal phosphate-dependent enzyme [Planctomycetota bacterium]|nr:aminotransferase class I/II-fold pyridoxal phosphate-dependent enzyme [Planctomycetota bacterium]